MDINASFNAFTSRNMAFEVMSLLGWRDFADLQRGLLSLG